ncbi:MAG: hypothetical protein HQ574_07225 [Chloroflexi bacterium]|nr:hypothetical protein [Chloroflexota bacterium]
MKDLINPWVIAGAIFTASLLLAGSFLIAGQLTPSNLTMYHGEAVLTIIPVPTYTPTPLPTQPEFPILTPTIEAVLGIQVGGYVQILGTEGEELRLRQEPTLNGEIIHLGLEGEIYLVRGGPEERDGYLWWELEAPLNETRQGWAVSNYLVPAQSP